MLLNVVMAAAGKKRKEATCCICLAFYLYIFLYGNLDKVTNFQNNTCWMLDSHMLYVFSKSVVYLWNTLFLRINLVRFNLVWCARLWKFVWQQFFLDFSFSEFGVLLFLLIQSRSYWLFYYKYSMNDIKLIKLKYILT